MALHCVRNTSMLLSMLAYALLAACSNGRGSLDEAPASQGAQAGFTLGSTVTGLTGSGLVLQNNGGNDLAVSTTGTIIFSNTLSTGAAYNVTVLTQPSNPTQNCTVTNGTGTVASSNITNVAVACTTTGPTGSFAVGGTVTGLAGTGLVLRNNGGDDLPISAAGEFSFATHVAAGSPYAVTVATPPSNPAQTCTVVNGSGTMGGADVTNVTVTCATSAFPVSVTVSGLVGRGLVLLNNGSDNLAIGADGTFTFSAPVASGAAYGVSVGTQPTNPVQSCAIQNATGTMGGAPVTNVTVSCATNQYTIGGTVSGLAGSGLTLRLNGTDDQLVTGNTFAFQHTVPSGTPYVVTVRTQPSNPTQSCSIANATGVVAAANVTNIVVTCTTSRFTVGGTVTGLSGSGLVLQKNGADDLSIASNGSFTFATDQASGSAFSVTVRTQPTNPSQNCTVADGSGTVGGGNFHDVRVTCAISTFSVRGNVSGLLGAGLVLRNNGGDDIGVDASGAFVFPQRIASGAGYNVTVRTQPLNPTQACSVANGSGTVGNGDVTNVAVSCTTSEFMVGGTVTGLAGSGLVLRNNGGNDLTINSNGSFNFGTSVPSGATYSVSIATQPTSPTQVCTLSNATGTVGDGPVTNIGVSCVTVQFTVGGTVSDLIGGDLVLQNNGTDSLSIAANGAFTFPTSLPTGTPFNVTVLTQPTVPLQACAVTNGSGTVGSANITTVSVSCVIEIPL